MEVFTHQGLQYRSCKTSAKQVSFFVTLEINSDKIQSLSIAFNPEFRNFNAQMP